MKKILLSLGFIGFTISSSSQNQLSAMPPCNIGPVTSIASFPYNSGAQTTCGAGDDVTATNANVICGSSSYYGGEDAIYTFTPTTTGPVGIQVTSTGSWMGIMLYNGCPTQNGNPCVGQAQSSLGNQSLCATVTAGQQYYLVIDSWPSPTCNPYTLSISGCSGAPTSGTAVASPSLMCATYTTNLSLSGSAVSCGITYQWQSGPSSTGPWTNLSGATASTATAQVTSTTYYRCILTCNSFTAASSPATASLAAAGSCGICGINSVTLPYSGTGLTTCGAVNDITSANVTNICGSSSYYGGEDAVYSFTPSVSGSLGIDLTSSGSWTGLMLYSGCPVSGGTCVGQSQSSVGSKSLCVNVTAGQAYYLVIDSWPAPTCNPYNLNIYTCTGSPAGGTAVAAPTAACASGGTIALSVSGSVGSTCGYSFQWQSAPVSTGPWSNIAGATSATYAPSITGNICFRRLTTCSGNTGTSTAVCASVGTCTSALGTGLTVVGSLPYSTSGTTCGSVNDITTSNVTTTGCSGTTYFAGEDQVFMFTPTTSGNCMITLTSSGTYTGLFLYNTCPLSCGGGSGCIASTTSSTGNKSLVVCLNAGTTYYLVLDSWSTPTCNPYSNLSISAPGTLTTSTSNDPCINPQPLLSSGTFTATTFNYTADTPGNITSVFCGSIENNQWFTFTANATTATFSITTVGGAACNWGVQAQVFAVTSSGGTCPTCNSFTSVSSPCYNPGTLTPGSVTATGLTVGQTYYLMIDGNAGAQCDFTIAGWSLNPLSVNLVEFAGENYSEGMNKLSWKVTMEKDMKSYIIQRSPDAMNYHDIGTVNSLNSSSESDYFFFDKNMSPHINYYRLRMLNSDGSYKYSNVVAINNEPNAEFRLSKVFPNPTSSKIYVSMDVPYSGNIQMEITDVIGHILYTSETHANYGRKVLEAETENLLKGIYYIRLTYNGETKVAKFSKQ